MVLAAFHLKICITTFIMARVGLPGAERLTERWFPPFLCDLPVVLLIQHFTAPRCFDLLVFCGTAKPTLSLDADAREGLALATSPASLMPLLTWCGSELLRAKLVAPLVWGWQQTLAEPLAPAPTKQEHGIKEGPSQCQVGAVGRCTCGVSWGVHRPCTAHQIPGGEVAC